MIEKGQDRKGRDGSNHWPLKVEIGRSQLRSNGNIAPIGSNGVAHALMARRAEIRRLRFFTAAVPA
jgi:hypothetical protein